MPKAKTNEEVIEEVQKNKFEKAEFPVCGHVNKQFHGIDGRLQDIACTLEPNHSGDHFCKAPALRQVDDNFETSLRVQNGEKTFTLQGKLYMVEEQDAEWSDAAGKPAAEVQPDLEQLKALKAKKNASEK